MLKSLFREYAQDETGNFAVIFLISSFVALIGAGVSIDASNMLREQNKLQNVADIALLAVAASGETDLGVIDDIIARSVRKNTTKTINSMHYSDGNPVTLTLHANYVPIMLDIFGIAPLSIVAVAEAEKPIVFDLVLVLDTTASMQGANAAGLRRALIRMLANFERDRVNARIAIVPFARYVNIGTQHINQPWLRLHREIQTEECRVSRVRILETCTIVDREVNTDGVITIEPSIVVDSCQTREETVCPETSRWYGCVGSRSFLYDQQAAYDSQPFIGMVDFQCGSPILELTSDFTAVRNTITSLIFDEATYLPGGLQWGWRLLDSAQPFPNTSTSDITKAIVLMTDGESTTYKVTPDDFFHSDVSENPDPRFRGLERTNTLTSTLCTNIKDDDILLYTVYYLPLSGNNSTLLENCASSPEQAFEATDHQSLISVFLQISEELKVLRLSN